MSPGQHGAGSNAQLLGRQTKNPTDWSGVVQQQQQEKRDLWMDFNTNRSDSLSLGCEGGASAESKTSRQRVSELVNKSLACFYRQKFKTIFIRAAD